jgi:hypothetical protein
MIRASFDSTKTPLHDLILVVVGVCEKLRVQPRLLESRP